jgi:small-conductance mechanosensitive channel
MSELWVWLSGAVAGARTLALIRGLVILSVGLVLARIAGSGVKRLLKGRASAQQVVLGRRVAFYAVLAMTLVQALREVGFDLTVLLGAAGILTVAVGFASQTSASNLISGLFLLGERPFVVGDVIRVASTTGEVVDIDLLSVKLRTFDNLSVRIPNETLLKSEITNLTRYPIRRIDLNIGIAYKEDLERVGALLQGIPGRIPVCLDEPKPLLILVGFGESSVDLMLCVWAARQNFLVAKNALLVEIKRSFDEAGIEIPFPQRTLHAAPGLLAALAEAPGDPRETPSR